MRLLHVLILIVGGILFGLVWHALTRGLTAGRSKRTLAELISSLERDGYVIVGGRSKLRVDPDGFTTRYSSKSARRISWERLDGPVRVSTGKGRRWAEYTVSHDEYFGRSALFRVLHFVVSSWNYTKAIHPVKGLDPEEVALLLNKSHLRFVPLGAFWKGAPSSA